MPLKVHFLNVGRGDCTIIEFPSGHIGIVDIDLLKILDPDTRDELVQEYRESMNYLIRKAAGMPGYLLEESFLRQEQAKLTDPFAYYDAQIGEYKDVFRLIITHPDMDHMTGLYRLDELEPYKDILNFWHTGSHDFNLADTTDEEWAKSPYDKRDWETYKKFRGSTFNPKALQSMRATRVTSGRRTASIFGPRH